MGSGVGQCSAGEFDDVGHRKELTPAHASGYLRFPTMLDAWGAAPRCEVVICSRIRCVYPCYRRRSLRQISDVGDCGICNGIGDVGGLDAELLS